MEQLRSELMQERSERHDLEMDKSVVERQVPCTDAHKLMRVCLKQLVIFASCFANWYQLKELKSRLADLEGQTRPSAGLTLLENKVQELEERLRSEER